MKSSILALSVALALSVPAAHAAEAPAEVTVRLDPALAKHASGRLMVFIAGVDDAAKKDAKTAPVVPDSVDSNPFRPTGASVSGIDVADLTPDRPVTIDGSANAAPTPFAALPPGRYRLQAVLDRDGSYDYAGRTANDWVSDVTETTLPGPLPALTLTHPAPTRERPSRLTPAEQQELDAAAPMLRPLAVPSALMHTFTGRDVEVRGWVALPPGYEAGTGRYPTVYMAGGFGATLESARKAALNYAAQMAKGTVPPMVWVVLDHATPTGTHEFADSVNNGPWGQVLAEEVVPFVDRTFRTDGTPQGRFLTGHSSGGWFALWGEVAHPALFGGTWPTAPDPSDFHDFTNVDLYRDNGNAYRLADGTPTPLVRDKGKVLATFETFARLEQAMGTRGGQLGSFEWVFSPKCPNAQPCPLFDRATGAIDPAVAAYWREHYDVAAIVSRDWAKIGPDLVGKIHLTVGDADTFYLNGSAQRLQMTLDRLGAKAQFRFLPGKTHGDLYEANGDRNALLKTIAREMYAVARPGNDWKPKKA